MLTPWPAYQAAAATCVAGCDADMFIGDVCVGIGMCSPAAAV